MNKFFKKALAVTLSLAMSVCVLSACGDEPVNDKDENGKTVFTVDGYPEIEGNAKKIFDQKMALYEENNPDANVEGSHFQFDLQTFYSKAAGGQLPNLFNTNFTEVEQCINAGYTADITEGLKKLGYGDVFNEKVIEKVSDKDGRVYAFPVDAYVLGLAVNMDMYREAGLVEADGTPKAPETYDQLVEYAKIIKEKTGKAGIALPTSGNAGGWIFTPIAWSFGTEFMKQVDGKWTATFDSPECAKALQWVKDLKWKHNVLPENTLVDNPTTFQLFGTDNAGMVITAGNYARSIVQYGAQPSKVGMVGLPKGPERHVTLMGGYVVNFAKNTTADQIDAGIRWIEMTNGRNLTDAYKQTIENDINTNLEKNIAVGIMSMSPYNNDVETVKYLRDMISEKSNINMNQVKLYNEFCINTPCDIQAEEPVCAQELYAILDNCIQEVLTNKDADPAEVLKKANSDFQVNYLDNYAN